jgi:hypothetical protein
MIVDKGGISVCLFIIHAVLTRFYKCLMDMDIHVYVTAVRLLDLVVAKGEGRAGMCAVAHSGDVTARRPEW